MTCIDTEIIPEFVKQRPNLYDEPALEKADPKEPDERKRHEP
jgi:hypothetical protein